MGRGESHACVPKRNRYAGVPVCQLHYGVQARVPNIRDGRVAEANSILRGPVVYTDTGPFYRGCHLERGGGYDVNDV